MGTRKSALQRAKQALAERRGQQVAGLRQELSEACRDLERHRQQGHSWRAESARRRAIETNGKLHRVTGRWF